MNSPVWTLEILYEPLGMAEARVKTEARVKNVDPKVNLTIVGVEEKKRSTRKIDPVESGPLTR